MIKLIGLYYSCMLMYITGKRGGLIEQIFWCIVLWFINCFFHTCPLILGEQGERKKKEQASLSIDGLTFWEDPGLESSSRTQFPWILKSLLKDIKNSMINGSCVLVIRVTKPRWKIYESNALYKSRVVKKYKQLIEQSLVS